MASIPENGFNSFDAELEAHGIEPKILASRNLRFDPIVSAADVAAYDTRLAPKPRLFTVSKRAKRIVVEIPIRTKPRTRRTTARSSPRSQSSDGDGDGAPRFGSPCLRDYQRAAVDVVLARIDANPRAYIAMPTGSGKSLVLASVANALLSRGRILVVAHRLEIVEQLAKILGAVTRRPVATLIDGTCSDAGATVCVAMVQSLTPKRLRTWVAAGPIAALLVDEAHHVAPGNSYARIVDTVSVTSPSAYVLGFTATPYRAGKARMQDVLTKCLFERTIPDLQTLNVLAPLTTLTVKLKIDLKAIRTRGGDYEQGALGAEMLAASAETAAKTAHLIVGRRSIIFAKSVAHARALRDEYETRRIPAYIVCGDTPKDERARTLASWRKRHGGCLVNVGIATEGFDEPTVSAIVIAAPTQSAGRYVQMVGRGTRKAPCKTECLIIDVTGRGTVDERQALFATVFLDGPGGGSRQKTSSKPGFLTTPQHDPKNQWIEVDGKYFLGIGRDRKWAAFRSPDNGLWTGRCFGPSGLIESFVDEPLPELMTLIRASIAAQGTNRLVDRDAPWRDGPVSDRALARLARYDARSAEKARFLTAGRVSDLILTYDARIILARHSGAF